MGYENEATYDDYYNDLYQGGIDVVAVPAVTEVTPCCTTASDEEAGEMIRGSQGAAAYIIVVVVIYAVPIMFFMIVYIFHRSSSSVNEKREMDRQVEKFVEHTIQLQDTWSRDNVKRLKRTIIPRVANSQAKELIERRPSCIALLHGSNVDLDRFSVSDFDVGEGGLVMSLGQGQGQGRSCSWDSLPEAVAAETTTTAEEEEGGAWRREGADASISGISSSKKDLQLQVTPVRPPLDDVRFPETQGMQTRDLRPVSRMVRIVEEDNSVAWAAQSRAHDGVTSLGRQHYGGGNKNAESTSTWNDDFSATNPSHCLRGNNALATMATPAASNDSNEHRIWIPLSSLSNASSNPGTCAPNSVFSSTGVGIRKPHRSAKVFQNKAGIVKYWKNLITADKPASSRGTSNGGGIGNDHDLDPSAGWRDDAEDSGAEPLIGLRRVNTNESHVLYISEMSSASEQGSSSSSGSEDDAERDEYAAAAARGRGKRRRRGNVSYSNTGEEDGDEENDYAELLFNSP